MTDAITFDTIVDAALHEQWDFVDDNLKPFLDTEGFAWALKNIAVGDHNRNVRDLAATILNRTDFEISEKDVERLLTQMEDRNEYGIVRYRLAIALYRRGIKRPAVLQMMDEARKHADVGKEARAA